MTLTKVFFLFVFAILVGVGIAKYVDHRQAVQYAGWSVVRISIDYPPAAEGTLMVTPMGIGLAPPTPQHGTCSGFMVGQNRVLTAAHCTNMATGLWADGIPAEVLQFDDLYDLALLRVVSHRNNHILKFRDTPLRFGEHVTAIGYAWGFNQLMFWDQTVKMLNAPSLEDHVEHEVPGVIMQGEDIKGMSGGPIVDDDGYVVSVVHEGKDGASLGVQVPHIRAFLLGIQ